MKKHKRLISITTKTNDLPFTYDICVTKDQRNSIVWKQHITMWYANTKEWYKHIRKTKAASLKDNGDSITITIGNDVKFTTDYSEFIKLQSLLLYYSTTSQLDPDELRIKFLK